LRAGRLAPRAEFDRPGEENFSGLEQTDGDKEKGGRSLPGIHVPLFSSRRMSLLVT